MLKDLNVSDNYNSNQLMPIPVVNMPLTCLHHSFLTKKHCTNSYCSSIQNICSLNKNECKKIHNPQWLNLMTESHKNKNYFKTENLVSNVKGQSLPVQRSKRSATKTMLPPLYNTLSIEPMSSLEISSTFPKSETSVNCDKKSCRRKSQTKPISPSGENKEKKSHSKDISNILTNLKVLGYPQSSHILAGLMALPNNNPLSRKLKFMERPTCFYDLNLHSKNIDKSDFLSSGKDKRSELFINKILPSNSEPALQQKGHFSASLQSTSTESLRDISKESYLIDNRICLASGETISKSDNDYLLKQLDETKSSLTNSSSHLNKKMSISKIICSYLVEKNSADAIIQPDNVNMPNTNEQHMMNHISDKSSLLYAFPGSLPDIHLVPSSPFPLKTSSSFSNNNDRDLVKAIDCDDVAKKHMFYLPLSEDDDAQLSSSPICIHNSLLYKCSLCMLYSNFCNCVVSADCTLSPSLPLINPSYPLYPSLSLHDSHSIMDTCAETRPGLSPSTASPKRCLRPRKTSNSYSMSRSPQLQEGIEPLTHSSRSAAFSQSPTHSVKMVSPSHTCGVYINRRSSDSDLSITPKGGSLTESGGSSAGGPFGTCPRPLMTQESFDNLIYPFLTMKSFPPGFIIHIGGTVCSRSVQLLDRGHLPEEVETRDSWWSDLRTEIRSHARSIGCNVVIGYEEFTSISEDVCLLNAVGTAAVINVCYQDLESFAKVPQKGGVNDPMSMSLEKKDLDVLLHHQHCHVTKLSSKDTQTGVTNKSHHNVADEISDGINNISGVTLKQPAAPPSYRPRPPPCTMCHIPYVEEPNPQKSSIPKCAICRKHSVNDVLLATIEIPPNMPVTGRGCLLQARVIRAKKDLKGEANAREMSDAMPFLEYDLHKQLYQKLMIKGLNGLFSLRIRVTIGEKFIIGIGTGTGIYLTALPAPKMPRIVSRLPVDECRTSEMQKKIQLAFERNKNIYGVNEISLVGDCGVRSMSDSKESDAEDSDEELIEVDVPSNKDMYDLDLNDLEDVEMINLLLEESPPSHVVAVTSQIPPGINPEVNGKNLQMFTRVWRSKLPVTPNRILFSSYFNKMLQSIYFKLRNLYPCILSGLRVGVELPEDDEVQITIYGMVLGHGSAPPITPKAVQSPAQKPSESAYSDVKSRKQDEGELIFRMEEIGLNEEKASVKSTIMQTASQPMKGPSFLSRAASITKNTSSTQTFYTAPSTFSSFGTAPSSTSISSGSSSGRSSFKLKSDKAMLQHHFQCPPQSDHFGVEITPLSFIPGAKIERHLGNLSFFFIRESMNIKEVGGLNGFMGSFITEVLALVRAHVAAIGGNAMISYFLSECVLLYNPHKSQGQCLINVGGDVVFMHYPSTRNVSERGELSPHISSDTTNTGFE